MKNILVITLIVLALVGCGNGGIYIPNSYDNATEEIELEIPRGETDHPLIGRWRFQPTVVWEEPDGYTDMQFFADGLGYSMIEGQQATPFFWSVNDDLILADDLAEFEFGRLKIVFEDMESMLYYRIDGEYLFLAEHPQSGGWVHTRIDD